MNVKIVAVGVGSSVDENELTQIAEGKKEMVVHVENFDALISRINEILQKSCQQRKRRPAYPTSIFAIH